MTLENPKIHIKPTIDDVEELSRDLLQRTHEFVLRLKEESDFLCAEMDKLKILIAKCRDYKKLESLHNSYGRLSMSHVALMERAVIAHMACERPLCNLIKSQNAAKSIEEFPEIPQLPEASQERLKPDFDISSVYRKYED